MIHEKLNVLKDNQVIDEKVFTFSHEAIEFLKQRKVIAHEDEADVFITHLAMATARQDTDEIIGKVDHTIQNEIQQSDYYEEAVAIWDELKETAPTDYREGEEGYFHLHLVTLLQTNR